MGTKRSHAEMTDETVHASRRANIPESLDGAPHSKQQPGQKHVKNTIKKRTPAWAPNQSNSSSRASIGALKKRVRDLARLLEHTPNDQNGVAPAAEMPADVRMENERALVAYRQELAEAQEERRRQKMIKRYHMVRFFERQKATRRLKKLVASKKRSEGEGKEAAELDAQIHEAEVDLNYTLYSPLYTKYLSLYVSGDGTDAAEEGDGTLSGARKSNRGSGSRDAVVPEEQIKRKPSLWYEVERRMRTGTAGALEELRNSTSFDADGEEVESHDVVPNSAKYKHKHKANGKESKAHAGDKERRPRKGADATPITPNTDSKCKKKQPESAPYDTAGPKKNRAQKREARPSRDRTGSRNRFSSDAGIGPRGGTKRDEDEDEDEDGSDSGGFFEE